jgi:protein SCO1/2
LLVSGERVLSLSSALLKTLGAISILVGACVLPGVSQAKKANEYTKPSFDEDSAISASRGAIGKDVSEYSFINRAGKRVSLNSFKGKPLIVSFIYTSCPQFCPMISQTIKRGVEIGQKTFGEDAFNIISIGFDTRIDNPNAMRLYADAQGLDEKNWYFLSTSADVIRNMTEELGFIYAKSPSGFDHLAQTTLIDSEGVVAHQVYGTEFEVPFLIEPLKDLIYGRNSELTSVEGLVNRVRLFCTVFDPKTGGYSFDFSLFIVLAMGGSALGFIFIFLVRSWYRIWRESRARKSAIST